MDWDDLRFFLAVARYKTLAAAAKHLNVTISTVSRRVASFQDAMGVQLLVRTADGYMMTGAGESIRGHVERVEAETLSVERSIAGHDAKLEGRVRITCSPFITNHLLVPSFAALYASHPGIVIESLQDLPGEPLVTHDADIALRLSEFDHRDLVVRKVGQLDFGLYSCVAYLGHHGHPDFANGCPGHRIIAQLEGRNSPQATWLDEAAPSAEVVFRTNSYEEQYWAVFCGTGLAVLPRFHADREPVLRQIETPSAVPPAAIWLGIHHSSRAMPRVRLVVDCIVEAIRTRSRNPAL